MYNLNAIFNLSDTSSIISVIFMIMGGVGIFLYGLNLMSSSLKTLAGGKLKTFISKATDNMFLGFLMGLLITVSIQSSAATIIIVVGLISAGLLKLKNAIPIMMGAHVGTTITAYIIGLNIGVVAFPLIFVSSLVILLVSARKWNLSGRIILGLGFLFLGLEFMSVSFGSFASAEWFTKLMNVFSSNWFLGFIAGIILTILIQSSSAFIGIVQELYIAEGSTMAMSTAITLVIGSNIGTTITALLASIGSNKESKQAAIANILIQFTGSLIFLPLLVPTSSLFTLIENAVFGKRNMFTLAFYHTFYNLVNSGICFALIPVFVKIVEKIIPYEKEEIDVSALRLNKELLITPPLALESAKNSIIDMSYVVKEMYKKAVNYFTTGKVEFFDEVNVMEEKVDLYEHLTHDYLMQLNEKHLNRSDSYKQTEYIDIIRDLERIGDHATNFVEFFKRYFNEGIVMPDNMKEDLLKFFDVVDRQVDDVYTAFKDQDKAIANAIRDREELVNEMEREYRLNVHSYLKTGEVNYLDIFFIDIVTNLERVSDHSNNIAEMIIDPHMMSTMITGTHTDTVDNKKN